jgi:hypothetical protein
MHTISITLDNGLYARLKNIIPNGKVSKFVSHAIEESLEKKTAALHKAYSEAYKDKSRNKEIEIWNVTDSENWE